MKTDQLVIASAASIHDDLCVCFQEKT